MSDTVSLSRAPNRITDGGAAPMGLGKEAVLARENIGEFLIGALGMPDDMVANRLKGMDMRERVFLELEMSARRQAFHSFDYDPMASR